MQRFAGWVVALAACGRVDFAMAPDAAPVTENALACPPGYVEGPLATSFDTLPAWAELNVNNPATTIEIADSALHVTYAPDLQAYAQLRGLGTTDAHRRILRTHVTAVPTLVFGPEALLSWFVDGNRQMVMGVQGENLLARVHDPSLGGGNDGYFEPFSFATDAWWQMRADETTVRFEVSADGDTWRSIFTMPLFPWSTNTRAVMAAGTRAEVPDPGDARFDLLIDCLAP